MMRGTEKKRGIALAGVICMAMFVLAVVFAGCGGESTDVSGYRTIKKETVTAANDGSSDQEVARAEKVESFDDEMASIEEEARITEPKEVTYEEAEAAYLARNYGEATEMFAAYTENKTENPWGYYMLGLSAWKAGDFEKAEGAFKLAIDLDPKHLKSHINLARVYLDAGSPDGAIDCVDDALEIEPGSAAAFRLKGRAFHQLGRREEAIDSYRRAIAIDGNDAWAMNNLALILIEQEEYQEALRPLARAVQIDGDVAVFHNNLGMALERCGYFRAAEKAYDMALNIEYYEKSSVNFERITQVAEEPGLEPVDLAVLSGEFIGRVEGWRIAWAMTGATDSSAAEVDTLLVGSTGFPGAVMISRADSTATGLD